MKMTGMLGEAWRDLVTGTSHACVLAVGLACLIVLLAGADWLTIAGIQKQTDEYVASGGSTWVLDYNNHVDGAACDRLASLNGVEAAGAVRQTSDKLVFAALPSTGVPIYETTPGALKVFALSTTGTQYGAHAVVGQVGFRDADSISNHATSSSARNTVRLLDERMSPIAATGTVGMTPYTTSNKKPAVISASSSTGLRTTALAQGVMLSAEAAKPFDARAGQKLALKDGRSVDVAGVFDWPDDGRKSGFSYAALTPVPENADQSFSQCWVRTWPQTKDIEALLRLAGDGRATGGAQERPMVSKLNTSKGSELDSAALFGSRLTVYAPWVALVAAVMLGLIVTRMRKLEMASALHCGVPKTALLTQIGLETLTWALAGVLISSPLLAWVWLENGDAEAAALTDTLLRVPVAALVGVLGGALVAVLSTRESHLLRYFKNR